MSILKRTLLIGVVIGIILFLLFLAIDFLNGTAIVFDKALLKNFGYHQIYSIVLTFANVYYFEYLNTKVTWKKYTKYRLLIGALGGVVVTMASIFFIRIFINMAIEGESFDEFVNGERAIFYVMALLITTVIVVFFHALHFYKELQKKKVTEQKIIAGTASAQFDALKNQLDPHFLFNSLNVLTSLIDENPDSAQKFTTSLSKVYRYVLEQKNKELVNVDEELQFAGTYISLLKMRFEDSIVFEIPEKASNPEAKVIPLSLQLLLENAVKHNIVNSSKPLHIKIYESGGNLVVENNLQPKAVVKKGSKVGLANIQQRYNLLTDRKVIINKSASHFTVKIPMLTKQISVMKTQKLYIEDKRYARAKEKVEKIKAFYANLTSYLIVIPVLAIINFRTGGFPWAIFPALGWGFGLLGHAMEAFGYNPFMGKNWEERKIREFMDED